MTEEVIRSVLLDTYGDTEFIRSVVSAITPKLAEMVGGEDRSEAVNLVWMNFSGGTTAAYVIDRIFREVRRDL